MNSTQRVAARWLRAGTVQAPPAMQTAISEWMLAVVAATQQAWVTSSLNTLYAEGKRDGHGRAMEAIEAFRKNLGVADKIPSRQFWAGYQELLDVMPLPGSNYHELAARDFQKLNPERLAALVKRLHRDLDFFEDRVEMLSRGIQGEIARLIKIRHGLKPYLITGVKPIPATGSVSKTFPVEMKGWKYEGKDWKAGIVEQEKKRLLKTLGQMREHQEKMGDGADPEFFADVSKGITQQLKELERADPKTAWDTITVVLAPISRGSLAAWNYLQKQVEVWVPVGTTVDGAYVKQVSWLRHELQHLAQDYMSDAIGERSWGKVRLPGPGKPSRHVMTPETTQHTTDPQGHELDDVEFMTRLQDTIDTLRHTMTDLEVTAQRNGVRFTREMRRAYLSALVGGGPPSDPVLRLEVGKVKVTPWLVTLQRRAPGKWKRAVKEIAAQLL